MSCDRWTIFAPRAAGVVPNGFAPFIFWGWQLCWAGQSQMAGVNDLRNWPDEIRPEKRYP